MLKSKKIQHTSIIFTTVFILKNRATQVYKKRNLDAVLKQLIKRNNHKEDPYQKIKEKVKEGVICPSLAAKEIINLLIKT